MTDDPDDGDGPGFPVAVWVAGATWIIVGLLQIILTALVTVGLLPGNPRGAVGGMNPVILCASFACSGVGAAVLAAGYRTATGRAGGTVAYSVGSFVLGALWFALAVLAAVGVAQTDRRAQFGGLAVMMFIVLGVVSVLFSSLYIVPGALSLAGRRQYRAWRAYHRPEARP